jgi:hypothetical protein
MNKISLSVLGLTLAFSAVLPAVAQVDSSYSSTTLSSTSSTGQPLTGTVDLSGQPMVKVLFPNSSEKSYMLSPDVTKSLNLTNGSSVLINNQKLGTITNINRQEVVVEFSDGTYKPYYLTQEGRRSLSPGDSVVITSNQRVRLASAYVLAPADVYVIPSMMASTSMSSSMSQPSGGMMPQPTSGTLSQPMAPKRTMIKPAPRRTNAAPIKNVEGSPATRKPMSPTEPQTDRVPVIGPSAQDVPAQDIQAAPPSGKPLSPSSPNTPAKAPDDGIPTIRNNSVAPSAPAQ